MNIDGVCDEQAEPNCKCAWSKAGVDLKVDITMNNEATYKDFATRTCLIKNLATANILPVPVVLDNYVDHNRKNDQESTSDKGPAHIQMRHTGPGNPFDFKYYPWKDYTWKDFQTASKSKINELHITRDGRYAIDLAAKDYGDELAMCTGCLVVRDLRRPTGHPDFACPTVMVVDTALTEEMINLVKKTC